MRHAPTTLTLTALLLLCSPGAWSDGFSVDGMRNGTSNSDQSARHVNQSYSDWAVQVERHDGAPQLTGKASVSCFADDKDDFTLDIDGLKPKAMYSVWLVTSMRPSAERAGVGPEPFTTLADAKGHLHVGAPLTSCPLVHYKWVEVREHPDSNPANLEASVRVARVRMIGE